MGILRVLSSRGDDRAYWGSHLALAPKRIDEERAVVEAERIFAQERAKGGTAFAITKDQPHKRIDKFDVEAEQIVIVPMVRGG